MDDLSDIPRWGREHSRYFLKRGSQPEREVTEEEFIAAEREAGFFPKPGCGLVATGGFSSGYRGTEIRGRIELV